MKKIQRVATSAFIYHRDKALIAQRAVDEPFLPNHWENVGGSLEWGEHPEDGLRREVKEEAGLAIKRATLYRAHHYVHENDREQIVEVAYICDPGDNPSIQLSAEHQAYQWINKNELPKIEPMTDK